MLVRLLFAIFFCVPLLAFPQQEYADSLSIVIQAAKEDTSKVILINKLILFLRDKDPKKALEHARLAKSLSEKLKYKKGLGNTLQNIGWIYYRKGDYVLALSNSLEALSINKEFNDLPMIANSLINIGAIQYEQAQYPTAISYFKQGYQLSKELNDRDLSSRALNNISFCYLALKNLDSAEYYVKVAIGLSKAGTSLATNFSERTLGDIYFEKNQWEKALASYAKCLKSAREQEQSSLIVSTLHRLGRTYLKLKQPDVALIYLNENVEKAKTLGYKDELEKTYSLLVDAYVLKHNLAKAFEFQSLFIIIHDSLHNQKSAKQIAELESKFQNEINEARMALLTKDGELRETQIKNQKILIYSFVVGLALLGGLVFALYKSNQKEKKINFELAEKNEEIISQAEQLGQLNTTKDKLFSIIGHDLRSPIAGLRGLMDLISREILTQSEFQDVSKKVKQNLDYLQEDLDNLLSWAHSQLVGFDPNPEFVLLETAIRDKMTLVEPVTKAKEVTLQCDVPNNLEMYIDKNHLDLIVRNLVSNAIKFSHAGGTINISADFKEGRARLSVKDAGVGMTGDEVQKLFDSHEHFTKPGTQKEKGMGLGLMLVKEFVDKNGGTIRVESEPGKGTQFTIEMKGRLTV